MIEIAPWGKFVPLDPAGCLINDCDRDHIVPPWTTLVAELRQRCLGIWPNRLTALYLRGSVPRGLAQPRISDLDSFALLAGEITPQDLEQSQQITTELHKRYLFCKKVELILLDQASITQPGSIWPSMIQIKSLQIWGEAPDLVLPPSRPGAALINYAHTWDTDLTITLETLTRLSPQQLGFSAAVKKQCAWIMRRMVRTGFELVMAQDQSYTPDLYHCSARFAAYFPQQRINMEKALELALEPSAHRPGLILFLRLFGRWLSDEVQSMGLNRPVRQEHQPGEFPGSPTASTTE
jgi:hypothetical protein